MTIPRTQLVAKLLLLCALASNVIAEDDIHLGRRLSNHRTRPHDVEQPGGVITKDDFGNMVEVAASQPKEQEAPPQATVSFRPQQTKIVNGDRPDKGDAAYPFLAQLRDQLGIFCGGQLITPDIVLTAAHCLQYEMPSTVTIWNGSQMQDRNLEDGVIHEEYDSSELINDLALIKLEEPALTVNEVNDGDRTYWELVNDYNWVETPPIIRIQRYQTPSRCTSLYSQGLAEDITTFTVIGHGTIKSGGNMADELLEADVHYVTNSKCDEQYYSAGWITDDMLCAADIVEKQDACQGDSGGPLFTRLPVDDYQLFTLVGVVSWGEGCAKKLFPGVYSRVAANVDWVDEMVCGVNGFSPKSCTADGKIRDYALDSLAGATSVSRRIKKNVLTINARAALYGEKLKEEVCELLGGDADETLSPSSSSPSTSDSPSHAPIISPSMVPSVSPSLMPSTFPSGSPSLPPMEPSVSPSLMPSTLPSDSPSLPPMEPSVSPSLMPSTFPSGSPSKPPGKSPTKKFITDKKANKRAKGIMYQLQAESGDVMIESISFKKRDDRNTNVKVYFQLGSYQDFPGQGMDPNDWGPPLFNGIPARTSSGLREAVLDDVIIIPKGEMASIYLAGRRQFMFEKGVQEFTVADDAGDFKIFTGAAMRRPFRKRLMNADFFGGITYYTYTAATKVTSTPSLSPSSSTFPTLSPSEDDGVSGRGGIYKVYTTPDANKARAVAKGVMFSITAKSKEVSITGLGIMGEEFKESDVWIYYQNGSYEDIHDALDEDEWIEVFKDKVLLAPNVLVDVELDEGITIPADGTVSLYVVSKKGVLYTKSSDKEFDIYAASEDFSMKVGTTTKKDFEKPDKLAEFAGRIMYET